MAVVESSKEGERPYAQISTLPLRVKAVNGELREPSMSMVEGAGKLVPEAPFVPVEVDPDIASTKVGEGVLFAPVTADGSSNAVNLAGGALFARTQIDTDYLVKPMMLGAEAFWQLRSPRSPERLELQVSLPAGATLRMSADSPGAAEIVKDGKPLTLIPAPTAVDADGYPVAASMSVSGDVLAVSVTHRDETPRYPILVDPYFAAYGSYNANTPFTGWGSTGPSNFTFVNGGPPIGISMAGSGASSQVFARHFLSAPGTAEIYRADLAQVTTRLTQGAPLWFYGWISGVEGGSRSAWTFTGYDANATQAQMPMYWSPYMTNQPVALCADSPVGAYDDPSRGYAWCREGSGTPGNQLQVGLYTQGTFPNTQGGYEQLPGATASIADPGSPSVTLNGVPSSWVDGLPSVSVTATQGGLGVASLRVANNSNVEL